MMSSHPCDACGGTGKALAGHSCKTYGPLSNYHHARECMPFLASCPVCLGAGRFPDQMPARDAVADAETLVRFVADFPGAGVMNEEEWRMSGVLSASSYAHSALDWGLADYIPGRTQGAKTRKRSERIRTYSQLAARAAFRAVPGLRGDK